MIEISKNNKFVFLKEKPDKDIVHGIEITLGEAVDEYHLPKARCDIVKGKRRYYFPEECVGQVKKVKLLKHD
jgi:hypothetical protein